VSVADGLGLGWIGGFLSFLGGGGSTSTDPALSAAVRGRDTDALRQAWIDAGLVPQQLPPPPTVSPEPTAPATPPPTAAPQPQLPPTLGFVAPLPPSLPDVLPPPVAATGRAAVATATGVLARVISPVLGVLWPTTVADATIFEPSPSPSGPARRRPGVVLDPTDPYPSRRVRRTGPRVFGMPVPEWRDILDLPARAVPQMPPLPEPVIRPAPIEIPAPSLPRVSVEPTQIDLPLELPDVGPFPNPVQVPEIPTLPAVRPQTPALPSLPDLLPFLPLYFPRVTGPRAAPGQPGTLARPGVIDLPSPTPLNPIQDDPLSFNPVAPSTADPCAATRARSSRRKRKCVERDNCNRCIRFKAL
jgi:hypothetical protein